MKGWKFAAILLTGFAAIGCGQGDVTQSDGTQSASGAAEPLFLFKDPATAGPRLDIFEIDGRASISVGGPIGTEGILNRVSGLEPLGDLYRILHPDVAKIPEELATLNERVVSERAEVDRSGESAVEAPEIEKDESTFKATVCKRIGDGVYRYKPLACPWGPNVNNVSVVGIGMNDRVYVWNPNPHTATLEHRLVSGVLYASATIPQYWWTYATITRDGPFMTATLTLGTSGVTGELGITHHLFSTIL